MHALQSPLERQQDLYQLAESQSGYFTTKQASALGYASNTRIYHVRAGNWAREHRGTYRLVHFPEPVARDGQVRPATKTFGREYFDARTVFQPTLPFSRFSICPVLLANDSVSTPIRCSMLT